MKKYFLNKCLLLSLSAFFSFSCGKKPSNQPNDLAKMYFFNQYLKNDGKELKELLEENETNKVGSCESYLFSVGNIDILFDGGFSYSATDKEKEEAFNSYSSKLSRVEDKIIEYVIVTHSDYDHISFLPNLFSEVENDKSCIKQIDYIIDFQSDLANMLSVDEEYSVMSEGAIASNQCLFTSETVKKYFNARDSLCKKKDTIHIPAGCLFRDCAEEDKIFAIPDNLKKKFNEQYATNFRFTKYDNEKNECKYMHYDYQDESIIESTEDAITRKSKYIFDEIPVSLIEKGELVSEKFNSKDPVTNKQKEHNNFYYAINLSSGYELRILYNFFYDHFYQQSISSVKEEDEGNAENGNSKGMANLISVCSSIVGPNFKFLSLGDGPGDAENSVIQFYTNEENKECKILENVSIFKASHHGSTSNNENSKKLMEIMKPDYIVIVGTICTSSAVARTVPHFKKTFMDNIKNLSETKILATSITTQYTYEKTGNNHYVSRSCHGDIAFLISKMSISSVSCSNDITHNVFVFDDEQIISNVKFTSNNNPLSIKETSWYTKLSKSNWGNS